MSILNIILSIVVSATIDSTAIMIGDQCDLHLQAQLDREAQVAFPVYGAEVQDGIVIADRTLIDTLSKKDGTVELNQYLTITSFKDSLFAIDPIPFVVDGDTIWSAPMSLNVIQPFEIDTALAVTDIKDIQDAPIWWWEIGKWILYGVLVVLVIIATFFIYRYLATHPAGELEVEHREPERPAEEIALEKLDHIREEKKWKDGRAKEYHTDLTDAVREYISRRFDVSSTEQTSDETLRAMRPLLSEQKELYSRLSDMLRLADLVKFAKWTTTPEENEQSLRTAYDFVNETKVEKLNVES